MDQGKFSLNKYCSTDVIESYIVKNAVSKVLVTQHPKNVNIKCIGDDGVHAHTTMQNQNTARPELDEKTELSIKHLWNQSDLEIR